VLISDQMVSILIPTYNAGPSFKTLLDALSRQQLRLFEIIVVDSSSSDETLSVAKSGRVQTHLIPKQEFDHGATRNFMGALAKGDILVYLTQDALPVDDTSIPTLVSGLLTDHRIAAAFGRQIPHANATAFAAHLRTFNYPAQSHRRTLEDRSRYGMKTFFCSNSFAAYRRKALDTVGWFQAGSLLAEDLQVCARLLKHGYQSAYVAEAVVHHSHNYSVRQDFARYFDLGAFFQKEQWLLEEFGHAEWEGFRFLFSEVSFLIKHGLPHYIPVSLLRMAAKGAGYRLGHLSPYLPQSFIGWASMHAR
jgi:rhamnosyltransferase